MKLLTNLESTGASHPINDGVVGWKISATELASITSGQTCVLITPSNLDLIVVDAWVDVRTKMSLSDFQVSLGDADGDDSFLLPVQVGAAASTGKLALDAASKGQKLSDHRTGLVKTNLTLTIQTGAVSPATATGEIVVYVKIAEITLSDADFPISSTSTTSVGNLGQALSSGAAGAWLISPNGSNPDSIASGDTLIIQGSGSNSTSYNSDTNTLTVAGAPLWTISDGSLSESIGHNDSLKIVGAGATSTAYDSSTNTLTVTSSSGGTTTWTAKAGSNSSAIADGDTVEIEGAGTVSVTYDATGEKFTITGAAAPIQGITATDGLALTGNSTNPQVEIDDIGSDNLILARDDGASLASSLSKSDEIMVNLSSGASSNDQLHRFSLQTAVSKVTFAENAQSNSFASTIGGSGYFTHESSTFQRTGLGFTRAEAFKVSGSGSLSNGDTGITAHWHIPFSEKAIQIGDGVTVADVFIGCTDSSGSMVSELSFDVALYVAGSSSAVKVAEKTGVSLTASSSSPVELQKISLAASDLLTAGASWAAPAGLASAVLEVTVKFSGTTPSMSVSDIVFVGTDARGIFTRTVG